MREVSGPILATSTVLVAVFGPTMLLPGITGQMFAQFGLTLIVSVLISMINAMTLSPALCAVLLKGGEHQPNILLRGFNRVFAKITAGYVKVVGWMGAHLVITSGVIVALFALLYLLFTVVPTSFLPDEDKGFFMIDVQLPESASLNRTAVVMDQVYQALEGDPAIEQVLAVNGYSILNTALQSNAGMVIVKLKPWHDRKDPTMHQSALQKKYQAKLSQLTSARFLVFGAPAIPGLGAVAGFSFVLEDTQSQGAQELFGMTSQLVLAANQRPEIARAFSTFRANYPQIWLDIDRVRAKTLGVPIDQLFLTLQTELGGFYVNDFNLFGKAYKVMVQADAEFRQREQDLQNIYVTNTTGEQIPVTALVRPRPVQGSDVLYRYNTYDSATINGVPNAAGGFSSGNAMDAMEAVADQLLQAGYKYDWTDSSFEERKSGNMAPIALALSLLFTFLFLAALYESFLMPLAILFTVPIAIIGALAALALADAPMSLYGQIGMVLLVGLASKTAILIVEFGKSLRESNQLSLAEATTESARLRFRPVMMTGLAFVAGVFPLVIASGAGAAGRASLGLAVFGGTIMMVVGGTLLTPIFFKLVQLLREKINGGRTPAPE
jgi:HAE1 family hydrophobic/amphiphilic exporter-1